VVGITPRLLLGAASILVAARWPGTTLQRAARVRRLTRALAAALLRGLAVRVERVGPTPPAVALFAANHLSWLDILVVLVALPDADVVAKREVGDWPLIGAITRAGSTVLIDRTRRRDVLRVVRALQARLDSGRSVVLFAEGTTTDGADVLPFRSALFEATVRAGVPVVPVTLQPDTGPGGPSAREHVCWWGDASLLPHVVRLAGLRHCRIVVRVGEAIVAGELPAAGSVSGCALRVLRRERRRSASRAAHVAVRRRFAPVR
jgi:1-acyl-sn-glycerol-3-phosphate acyltransferase